MDAARITVRDDGSIVIELPQGLYVDSRWVKFAADSGTARVVNQAVQRAQQHVDGERGDPLGLVEVEPVDSRVCKAYGDHRIATRHRRDECPFRGDES